jgi:hypothetical protein
MEKSDLEGFNRSGVIDRRRGASFHANPHYTASKPWATVEDMLQWHDACSAWAAGWLAEDNGRDQAVARQLKVRCW